MRTKEERLAARAEREATRKTKRDERLARVEAAREEAFGPRRMKHTDLTPDMFAMEVRENIATAGFGTTSGLKYRWQVTRVKSGEVVKVGYDFTIKGGQRQASRWIASVCEGKKKIAITV